MGGGKCPGGNCPKKGGGRCHKKGGGKWPDGICTNTVFAHMDHYHSGPTIEYNKSENIIMTIMELMTMLLLILIVKMTIWRDRDADYQSYHFADEDGVYVKVITALMVVFVTMMITTIWWCWESPLAARWSPSPRFQSTLFWGTHLLLFLVIREGIPTKMS